MNNTLAALRCSGCSAPGLVDLGDGTVRCDYCGSIFAHPDRVCPKCETVSDLDDLDCPRCGQPLRGLCPSCNAPNPLQTVTCYRCGTPLDLLASVAGRAAITSADFIYQRGAEASALKQKEEQASQERLARMWDSDQERARRLGQSRARQQQQEKILATVAAVLVILLIAGILLFVLLAQLAG